MRKAKTLLAMILCLSMVFALAACGQSAAPASTPTEEPAAEAEPTEAATPALDYPTRDITVLVTFEAGGTTDVAVRTFVKYIQKYVPVTINVLNISGSGGNVGLAEAVQQDPDGYYFVIQSGPFPMNAALGNVTYTYEDFDHVSMMFQSYMALAVRADSSYQTFDDFKAAAQAADPGTFKYGVYAGSPMVSTRLALEDALDVQFHIIDLDKAKSTELLAGRVEAYCDAYAQLKPYTESGDFRILGVFADERLANDPDIPTFKEMGIDYIITQQCYGMWAPKGTPAEILDYMNNAILQAYNDPELQAEMDSLGYAARYTTREEYSAWLENIYSSFADFVANMGI